MRAVPRALFSAFFLLAAAALRAQPLTPAPARVPVVLELFTSEGCSSCPPADAVLSTLMATQPVTGAEIIPLGLHVTYWDQLGWRDAASLADATVRQQDYSRVFGEDRVYTPQAVIDGHDELVGSDEAGVARAVARAAMQPHARVTLSATFSAPDAITAVVAVHDVPAAVKEKLRTVLFVTEDDVTSTVTRGENGGRTLHHDAVVRRVSSTEQIAGISPRWRRDRLHVVAVVQGERSQRIVGAATASVR